MRAGAFTALAGPLPPAPTVRLAAHPDRAPARPPALTSNTFVPCPPSRQGSVSRDLGQDHALLLAKDDAEDANGWTVSVNSATTKGTHQHATN